MRSMEKSAMTQAERNKYIKATILAAASAVAVGTVARASKANKKRAKALDIESSKNAIVIPVKKRKFMEDLPTPEELAESRGETVSPVAEEAQSAKTPEIPYKPVALLAADSAGNDIEARKKEILRSRARAVDFFGKRASESKNDSSSDKEGPEDKDVPDSVRTRADKKDKDDDVRVVLRDQQGKFVSPTNPVAVESVEKWAAVEGVVDTMLHPWESLKRVGGATVDKPVWIAGGTLASLFLAAKISDAISERRRKRSKERLDEARSEYVNLLEGSEKDAQDVRDLTGTTVGTALLLPAVLSAIVTNKIIENRKADKKKQKEMSDSYPDEPIVLYKTSEDKTVQIDAGTALMLIMVKSAMMYDAEMAERESMEKSALFEGVVGSYLGDRLGRALFPAQNQAQTTSQFSDDDIDNAVEYTVDRLSRPENSRLALDMFDAYRYPDDKKRQAKSLRKYKESIGPLEGTLPQRLGGTPRNYEAISNDPRFKARLAANGRLQDMYASRFANNKDYIAYKNRAIDDYISNQWGLERGGILHTILSWLAKNTGIGGAFFNSAMRNGFAQAGEMPQQEQKQEQEQGANVAAGDNNAAGTNGGDDQTQQSPNGSNNPPTNPPTPPQPQGSPLDPSLSRGRPGNVPSIDPLIGSTALNDAFGNGGDQVGEVSPASPADVPHARPAPSPSAAMPHAPGAPIAPVPVSTPVVQPTEPGPDKDWKDFQNMNENTSDNDYNEFQKLNNGGWN